MSTNINHFCKLTGSLLPIVIAVSFHIAASGQSLTIEGPSCVRNGVEYQYIIKGNGDNQPVQVCIKGGVLAHTKQTCTGDSLLTEVRVEWTDSISGELSLQSAAGKAGKTVSIAKELNPGSIDREATVRIFKAGTKPADIIYTFASGGGCNPVYEYQWQQSTDNLKWTDIDNTNKQRFSFQAAAGQSFYYRRKVTDTSSGNIAYTEPVALFAEPAEKSDTTKN